MDDYTNVARRKIAELIRRDNFEKIEKITAEFVILVFDNRACKVCNFGNVKWRELEPKQK